MTLMAGFTATAQTDVAATPERVWAALTKPEQIAAYMQGSRVTTTWHVGSSITWDGEYDGRSYQDKGKWQVGHAVHPRPAQVRHQAGRLTQGKLGEPGRHVTGVDPLKPGSQPELVSPAASPHT